MEASFFAAGTMPAELVSQGTDFLRRRFFESWNITRSDITNEILSKRRNLVMLAGESIAAWLGIEADGELTNACVERGYPWKTALQPLILQAFEWDDNHAAFAFVPAEKLASAYIFMSLGMVFPASDQVCVKRISYPERSILLVKIVRGEMIAAASMSSQSKKILIRQMKCGMARMDSAASGAAEV